jgi:hypothetical protein
VIPDLSQILSFSVHFVLVPDFSVHLSTFHSYSDLHKTNCYRNRIVGVGKSFGDLKVIGRLGSDFCFEELANREKLQLSNFSRRVISVKALLSVKLPDQKLAQ